MRVKPESSPYKINVFMSNETNFLKEKKIPDKVFPRVLLLLYKMR